jgi:hypothetical protein
MKRVEDRKKAEREEIRMAGRGSESTGLAL